MAIKIEDRDDVLALVKADGTWFRNPSSEVLSDHWMIEYSDSTHGDKFNESPGTEDIKESRRLRTLILERYPMLNVTLDSDDETVYLLIDSQPKRWYTKALQEISGFPSCMGGTVELARTEKSPKGEYFCFLGIYQNDENLFALCRVKSYYDTNHPLEQITFPLDTPDLKEKINAWVGERWN